VSAASRREHLVFGAPPRADLLPPEIKHDEGIRRQRRGLVMVVGAVVVLMVLGYVFVVGLAAAAQQRLKEANDETAAIAVERAKYVEGEKLSNEVQSAKIARQLATYIEADWALYLTKVGQTLPAGTTVYTVDVKLPDVAPPGPVISDVNSQIATVQLVLYTNSTLVVPDVLDRIDAMPGLVDVAPTAIAFDQEKGAWSVNIEIHVNALALENAFADDSTKGTK